MSLKEEGEGSIHVSVYTRKRIGRVVTYIQCIQPAERLLASPTDIILGFGGMKCLVSPKGKSVELRKQSTKRTGKDILAVVLSSKPFLASGPLAYIWALLRM